MKRLFVVLLAISLVLAACGGETSDPQDGNSGDTQQPADDVDSGGTEATDPPQSDDSGGGGGLPPGGTGTVTVDGEEIQVDWVGNCLIDEQFNPHPDDLDLTAALGNGIEALFIRVSHEDLTDGQLTRLDADMQRQNDGGNYVSYDADQYMMAPDGTWYQDTEGGLYIALFTGQPHENEPLESAPLTINGDNVSGSVTLYLGSTPIEVAFDLDIAEAVDCSL
jgi:hypothetical protein